VTPPKDPITEVETFKKRKGSMKKPSSQKNSKDNKTPFQTVLMIYDIDLIIVVV